MDTITTFLINLPASTYAILISIMTLICSIGICIYTLRKSRVIYDVERMKFFINPGDSRSDEVKNTDEELRKKLDTGKYTIITNYKLHETGYNIFVLGRIKK
jgi:hypothetical protein